MLSSLLRLSFFVQLISASVNIVNVNNLKVYDAYSCELPNAPTQEGFDVDFYTYSSGDNQDFNSSTYVAYGYTQSELFGSTTGLTNPSDDLSEYLETDYIAVEGVYAENDLTITNFTAQFTGYFYAPISGYYDFLLTNTDDAVMLFMATEAAFDCCSGTIEKSKAEATDAYQVYAYLQWHIDGTPSSSYTQFLEEGKYYPIRIVYINVEGSLAFNFAVTLPSGKNITDFGGYIYSAKEYSGNGTCEGDLVSSSIEHHTTTEYIHWTSSVSSATTETNTESWGTNTVIDYIPDYTTTTTDVWTGFSTSRMTIYPSNSNESDTVTVEVFTPRATNTSTITWSGTYTSTFTTIVPTNVHIHATVEIEIPSIILETTIAAVYTSSLGETNYTSVLATTTSISTSMTTFTNEKIVFQSSNNYSSVSSTISSSLSENSSLASISSATSGSSIASSTTSDSSIASSTTSDSSITSSTTSDSIIASSATSIEINATNTSTTSIAEDDDDSVSFTDSIISTTSFADDSTLSTQISNDTMIYSSYDSTSQVYSYLSSYTSNATTSTSSENNDTSSIEYSNSGIRFQTLSFLTTIFAFTLLCI